MPAVARSVRGWSRRRIDDAASDTRGRRTGQRAHGRRWVPLVLGLLTAVVGLIDLASALSHGSESRIRLLVGVIPGTFRHAATAATTVTGVLLLSLGHGLRRRKRRAWRAVVALLSLSIALHLVKGLDVEEAVVSLGLLAALIGFRDEFLAKGDPRTRWRAVAAFVVLLATSVVIGLVLVSIRLRDVVPPHPLGAELQHVLLGLVGIGGPLRFRTEHDSDIVTFTLASLGLLTALTTAYLALRPATPTARLTPEDEQRLRELLARHGSQDSLGYFALRHDKSVIWSPTGKSAIAYRVVSGVALASGDPIGDREAWPGAITAWMELAGEHAWVPAVMGCGEPGATAYDRAGLTVLEIGDEAVVEVGSFTLEGRAMRGIRQAVGKVERAGYAARVQRVASMTDQEKAQVRAAAESWRGAQTERGFSMALGRFGDPADGDCVVVIAEKDGRLRALLHFVPWGSDGLSLDLMRRDRSSDNGLNEFLIVSALRAAPELGVQRLSLNFAVFRQALEHGERLGASPLARAWRGVLVFVSRWFQIESLYRFNAKFRPIWEPRFLGYPSPGDLPRVALAALEAEAFLVWPRRHGSLMDAERALRGPERASATAGAGSATPGDG